MRAKQIAQQVDLQIFSDKTISTLASALISVSREALSAEQRGRRRASFRRRNRSNGIQRAVFGKRRFPFPAFAAADRKSASPKSR
jgi:hypothetical protein